MSYEKSTLITVTEQIYALKGEIQDLNRELEYERFRERYMPKKKSVANSQFMSRVTFLFVVGCIAGISLIGAIILFVEFSKNTLSSLMGIPFGIALACIVCCFKIVWTTLKGEKLSPIACSKEHHQIQERIAFLTAQLLDKRTLLEQLNQKQKELLSEKKQIETFLEANGILVEGSPSQTKKSPDGFCLKEEDNSSEEQQRLFEMYTSEENLIREYLKRLQVQVDCYNKEMMEIEDNFAVVKQKLIVFFFMIFLLVIVQSFFFGTSMHIYVICCILFSVLGIIYIDHTCSNAVLLYLIEHDSEITKEYAFCNHMIPVYKKRMDIMFDIEENEKELMDIQQRKNALDI